MMDKKKNLLVSYDKRAVNLGLGDKATCALCLEDKIPNEMLRLAECGCSFCFNCCKQYLTICIQEGFVTLLTCPDAECPKQGSFKSSEIENVVGRAMYEKYVRLKFNQAVDLDPGKTWCPEVGCETICHIAVNDHQPERAARRIICPTCSLQFCSKCKAKWHATMTCDESMQKTEGITFEAAEDSLIKRCPLCDVPIERNDGCAQMMCKRCKHVFCWYCLTSLDDDFLLRHYDKGPCKNKLGHSRASVIWHRTQVVGIFAGFGVLLLIASPFLLLAAPCIICCKCKACSKCCHDDNAEIPT